MAGDFYVADDPRIGENTVVGAGSAVTRDLPTGVFGVGNPARVVRELTDDDFDAPRGPLGPRGRA
ncbi:hypothetical protein [Sanguibacter massiliensis]|uniref:hypothetical protein n=1 Tax=Sanguibacter massiliensis TaxID=1973217 RepID=UPI000C821153